MGENEENTKQECIGRRGPGRPKKKVRDTKNCSTCQKDIGPKDDWVWTMVNEVQIICCWKCNAIGKFQEEIEKEWMKSYEKYQVKSKAVLTTGDLDEH